MPNDIIQIKIEGHEKFVNNIETWWGGHPNLVKEEISRIIQTRALEMYNKIMNDPSYSKDIKESLMIIDLPSEYGVELAVRYSDELYALHGRTKTMYKLYTCPKLKYKGGTIKTVTEESWGKPLGDIWSKYGPETISNIRKDIMLLMQRVFRGSA